MPSTYRIAAALVVAARVLGAQAASAQARDTTDHFRWLEEVSSPRAMTWVHAENDKTTAVLTQDPRFAANYRTALAQAQATDRLPYGRYRGGQIYNFWQDAKHVRGIMRKTTVESYRTRTPLWTTMLDLDSLAKVEKANWVWKGANCVWPKERRCLVFLSDGGEDAITVREFDLGTRNFVKNGFVLPKGKQNVAWVGSDTVLVAREWNPGELTKSGYPYIVKRLVRGQPLSAAHEIYRGKPEDVSTRPGTLVDAAGHRLVYLDRSVSFFETRHLLVRGDDVVQLNTPAKSNFTEMIDGQVIVRLSEPWTTGGTTIPAGSLTSFDLGLAMKTPDALAPVPVYQPGPRESVNGASATRDRLLVGITENVKGRVLVFSHGSDGRWTHTRMDLPDNAATNLQSTDMRSNRALISVAGFLLPSSIWEADAVASRAKVIKSLPARFDASHAVVEQLEATSKDGTLVPYFIVRPKIMPLDGSTPVILNAYGGFEVSSTPYYDAERGKLWLERGGAFVLANIRGGGEFGPAWHEAGLKTHRQVIYDDFAAVAQDLIARKITSPRRLGIVGGSNGGLLMGVAMTQHPELYGAVEIAVPLLDMLRYEQIAAGASWVGEYGSVANADERAFLASISPYHNLATGVKYPVPFIWTTTKDDRVGPQHARKFAAKMGEMGLPYLFYEVIEGGHGSGANAKQQAHTSALSTTYFMRELMDAPIKAVP